MGRYTRVSFVLDGDEMAALRQSAERNIRQPRDQMRYIIRQGLGLIDSQPNQQSNINITQEEKQR